MTSLVPHSTEAFEALHKKKGILSNIFHFGKKKHDDSHNGAEDPNSQEALQAAFDHAHAEESSEAVIVANLQLKFDKLKEQVSFNVGGRLIQPAKKNITIARTLGCRLLSGASAPVPIKHRLTFRSGFRS